MAMRMISSLQLSALSNQHMKDFRELKVWRKAHEFVLVLYGNTRGFPSEERFGQTSQLRRGATSIASNIAEGCGRRGDADFARFLQMSLGSASEVEYQLLLAKDLGYLSVDAHRALHDQVTATKRMLTSLCQKLRADR